MYDDYNDWQARIEQEEEELVYLEETGGIQNYHISNVSNKFFRILKKILGCILILLSVPCYFLGLYLGMNIALNIGITDLEGLLFAQIIGGLTSGLMISIGSDWW